MKLLLKHSVVTRVKDLSLTILNPRIGTAGVLALQDANSPLMEELRQLHDFINLILVFVIRFVGLVILMLTNSGGFINKALLEIQIVE